MGTDCQHDAPAALPTENLGTHCIGGWVGLRAGLERCGKSRTHRDSIPGSSSLERVAIPTALSWPYYSMCTGDKAAEG
jgi:hypothetical protein